MLSVWERGIKVSYIKILFIFSVIAAGAMAGIKKGNVIIHQYQELIYLKKTVLLIHGEIRYNLGTVGEVFLNVSKRVKEPYSKAFKELSEELENHNGREFPHMWNTYMVEAVSGLGLSEQDVERFKELGENIGYLDIQMQLNYLDFYIEKLNDRISDVKAGLDGNVKLCRTLGIMGGLLAAIFLL